MLEERIRYEEEKINEFKNKIQKFYSAKCVKHR